MSEANHRIGITRVVGQITRPLAFFLKNAKNPTSNSKALRFLVFGKVFLFRFVCLLVLIQLLLRAERFQSKVQNDVQTEYISFAPCVVIVCDTCTLHPLRQATECIGSTPRQWMISVTALQKLHFSKKTVEDICCITCNCYFHVHTNHHYKSYVKANVKPPAAWRSANLSLSTFLFKAQNLLLANHQAWGHWLHLSNSVLLIRSAGR